MRLMFISDIHGAYDDLEQVLRFYRSYQPDKLVILGDILYHGPRNDLPVGYAPKKVIPALNELKDRIIAVRGNCDAEVDQMVLDFPIMADYTQLYVDGHTFFVTHGHLFDEHNFPHLHEGDVYMYGHFHVPVFKQVNGYYMVNPNSIALPKEGVKSFMTYENHVFTRYDMEGHALEQHCIAI